MTKHKKAHSSTHAEAAPHRTTLQTIVLIYVLLHGVFWTIMTRSFVLQIGPEDTTLMLSLLVLGSIASIVAGIGMWIWKRWGLYLYAVSVVVVSILVFVDTGGSMLMLFGSLLPPIIVAYILQPGFSQFK